MYSELMRKLMQPIEAYPVLFYYSRNILIYCPLMELELNSNIIYKN